MGRQDAETETMVAHLPDTASALTTRPWADGDGDEQKLVGLMRPSSLLKSNELARKCRALATLMPMPFLPIPKPAPPTAFTIHGSDKRVKSGATESDRAGTLMTAGPGESTNSSTTVAMNRFGVRRLTCREAERLQGFPDDYTLIPRLPGHNPRAAADHRETVDYLMRAGWSPADAEALADTPDGPRYKAIGNSMAVPVMAWIGQRIEAADKFKLTDGQA